MKIGKPFLSPNVQKRCKIKSYKKNCRGLWNSLLLVLFTHRVILLNWNTHFRKPRKRVTLGTDCVRGSSWGRTHRGTCSADRSCSRPAARASADRTCVSPGTTLPCSCADCCDSSARNRAAPRLICKSQQTLLNSEKTNLGKDGSRGQEKWRNTSVLKWNAQEILLFY